MDPDGDGGDGGIDGYYDYYRTTTTGDRRVGDVFDRGDSRRHGNDAGGEVVLALCIGLLSFVLSV